MNNQIKDFGRFPYSRDSDLISTTATSNGLLTNQMCLIYQINQSDAFDIIRLTNQMRLIYQINQSDGFDISD
jgi:hypothetical protein